MKHEKIFKRLDGSRVMVSVSLWTDRYRKPPFCYDAISEYCPPNKRNFRLSKYDHEKATPEQIMETKKELWHMIDPEGETINESR